MKIIDAKDFKYIGTSANVNVPTVDDVQWWGATCHAMDVFGLSAEDQMGARHVLAAVLHLGDVKFESVEGGGENGSKCSKVSADSLTCAAIAHACFVCPALLRRSPKLAATTRRESSPVAMAPST